MAAEVLVAARAALAAGLCPIPAARDGTKRPYGQWTRWQQERPHEELIDQWFDQDHYPGMGLVCGEVSGGLEMLELEGQAVVENLDVELFEAAEQAGLYELVERIAGGYQEYTPSGGIHWLYRCAEVSGNLKLARRVTADGEVQVLIETRGEGGFTVVAPSNGTTHPSGRPWERVAGGFDTIAVITPDERAELHRLCRLFDRMPEQGAPRVLSLEERLNRPESASGPRPGDDYNMHTTWADVLEPHGWVRVYEHGQESAWRRPGKDRGISATTNHSGTDTLKVFSSSTAFDTECTYDRFGAYAVLEHGGDLRVAAQALSRDGYGWPSPPTPPAWGPMRIVTQSGPRPSDDDIGNALRFWRLHHAYVRYVAQWGTWLAWTGTHWAEDHHQVYVTELAKQIVDVIWTEIPTITDKGELKRAIANARSTARESRLRACLVLARGLPGIAVEPDALDADPDLLNVANGTLELATGALRPHAPDDLITKRAAVEYDARAEAPLWNAFLEQVVPDPEVRHFLALFAGYALTGHVHEHVLLLHVGVGSNGKSTFVNVLRTMLGDYGGIARKDLLVVNRYGQHDTSRQVLQGRRLVTAAELEHGSQLAESEIKELTGESRLSSRRLYSSPHEFTATHKLMISANYRPQVEGTDEAIWRRIRLVEWPVHIAKPDQDTNLPDKLATEAPGILNWALEGLREWRAGGLTEPAAVILSTASYRESQNLVGRFLTDSGLVVCPEDALLSIESKDLKSYLEQWNEETGENLGYRSLTNELKRLGARSGRNMVTRGWSGIGLLRAHDAMTLDDAPAESRFTRAPGIGTFSETASSGVMCHGPSDAPSAPIDDDDEAAAGRAQRAQNMHPVLATSLADAIAALDPDDPDHGTKVAQLRAADSRRRREGNTP